jgi:hypothetical protein
VACFGHDVAHPALTNRYLISNRDKLAIKYNDYSVLENMHASLTLKLLSRPECDFLSNLSADENFVIRSIIISMILTTDMAKHFEIYGKFRLRANIQRDLKLNDKDDR